VLKNLPRERLLVTGLALAGALIAWLATLNGTGLSPDSVSYIRTARQLAAGSSILEIGTHWPPGYPLLLHGFSVLPGEEFGAARFLAVLAILAAIVPANLVLQRELHGPYAVYLRIAALVAMLASASYMAIFWVALTEGLFSAALLWSLYAALAMAERPTMPALLVLAAGISVMSLLRYASAPFILALALCLVPAAMHWGRAWQVRTLLALMLALVPLVLWLSASSATGDGSGPRQIAWHPVGMLQLKQFGAAMQGWTGLPPLLAGLVFVASLLAAAALWWRTRTTLLLMCLLIILGYLSFLVLSISLMDAHTPLDNRILTPLYPVWLIMLCSLFSRPHLERPKLQLAAVAVLVVACLAGMGDFNRQFSQAIRYGIGFNDWRYAGSPIFQATADFPLDEIIYSNAKEFFYLLQNREVRVLPAYYNAHTLETNPHFDREMDDMVAALSQGKGSIVWVDFMAGRRYHPDVDFLVENLPLEVMTKVSGGSILRVKQKNTPEGD